MGKKGMALLLALACLMQGAMALAETKQGAAYGVYAMEGEHPDSLIRVAMDCEDGQIADVQIDEKLIPYAVGGAAGWAELNEEQAALLGDAVISVKDKVYPAQFALGDVVWQGTADEADGLVYTAQIDGADVELMAYLCTDEGGAWYFAQEQAGLLDASGETVVAVEIGTKASIEHGVGFWPSELKFPGNIEKIRTYLLENGADYALSDVAKGEDGVWRVADAVTGATLAGTPNYLRLAQQAYEKATEE